MNPVLRRRAACPLKSELGALDGSWIPRLARPTSALHSEVVFQEWWHGRLPFPISFESAVALHLFRAGLRLRVLLRCSMCDEAMDSWLSRAQLHFRRRQDHPTPCPQRRNAPCGQRCRPWRVGSACSRTSVATCGPQGTELLP